MPHRCRVPSCARLPHKPPPSPGPESARAEPSGGTGGGGTTQKHIPRHSPEERQLNISDRGDLHLSRMHRDICAIGARDLRVWAMLKAGMKMGSRVALLNAIEARRDGGSDDDDEQEAAPSCALQDLKMEEQKIRQEMDAAQGLFTEFLTLDGEFAERTDDDARLWADRYETISSTQKERTRPDYSLDANTLSVTV